MENVKLEVENMLNAMYEYGYIRAFNVKILNIFDDNMGDISSKDMSSILRQVKAFALAIDATEANYKDNLTLSLYREKDGRINVSVYMSGEIYYITKQGYIVKQLDLPNAEDLVDEFNSIWEKEVLENED